MRSVVVVFALLFLHACGDALGQKEHKVLNSENAVMTTLFPRENRIETSLQKPIVWFFFTANCGACKEAIPLLNRLLNEYSNQIEIIGVLGQGDGGAQDMALIERHNIAFKVISEPSSSEYLSRAFGGVRGVPAIFILDKFGMRKKSFFGLVPYALLSDSVKIL